MHIAICDDNGADRKQLERLLKRESDKRASTSGILYVDSYGNEKALLNNPKQYDLFFIDMCLTPGVDMSRLLSELVSKGVQAPVVLCCSKIDYRQAKDLTGNLLYLDKAIRADELSSCIDAALEILKKAPSLIELREEDETIYVKEAEILYVVPHGNVLKIQLTGGRTAYTRDNIPNLFSQWTTVHKSFLSPSASLILNCRNIQAMTLTGARMIDGKSFLLLPPFRSFADSLHRQYERELRQ